MMTGLAKHTVSTERISGLPYPHLYIYYVNGRVPGHGKRLFGPSFIGNWQEEDSAFLFFTEPADEAISAFLADRPGLGLTDRFEMSYEDWHGGPILPFKAGRFRIMPPWSKVAVEAGELGILLDPGVVFGAGNHPTTRDCLNALQWLILQEPLGPMETVLDLGAGTGLLAIAASRLGVRRALAVDNIYLAAQTTAGNVRSNRLDGRVQAVCGRAEDFIGCRADLVVANIHYDVMRQLIASPGFRQKRGFVLSGLMRSQAGRIKAALAESGASIRDEWIRDGIWHTICGSN